MIRSKESFHAMREEEIQTIFFNNQNSTNMAINATSNGTTARELIPTGNYIGRCFKMVHIGTIKEIILGEEKILNKVRIAWELPTEMRIFSDEKGEQPLVIDKEYTLSMHEKSNLRKDLKSWRGKDFSEAEALSFDVTKLMSVPCFINIIHKPSKKDPTRFYEEIAGITPMPKGVTCPDQINPTFIFDYDNFDLDKFNSLPEFVRNKMITSVEYTAMTLPEHNNIINEDDLPF